MAQAGPGPEPQELLHASWKNRVPIRLTLSPDNISSPTDLKPLYVSKRVVVESGTMTRYKNQGGEPDPVSRLAVWGLGIVLARFACCVLGCKSLARRAAGQLLGCKGRKNVLAGSGCDSLLRVLFVPVRRCLFRGWDT